MFHKATKGTKQVDERTMMVMQLTHVRAQQIKKQIQRIEHFVTIQRRRQRQTDILDLFKSSDHINTAHLRYRCIILLKPHRSLKM